MDKDGTEATAEEVMELLEASRSTACEMAHLTEDKEHAAIFASIGGLANVLREVIKRLMEMGETVEQDDLD